MNCLLKIALARCHDSEGDARFGKPHGGAFGSVEVGAGLDDLAYRRLVWRLAATIVADCGPVTPRARGRWLLVWLLIRLLGLAAGYRFR
jgi:hypothetical protein